MKKRIIITLVVVIALVVIAFGTVAIASERNDMGFTDFLTKVFKGEIKLDDSTAAIVNGTKISAAPLESAKAANPDVDIDSILETLIDRELLVQQAKKQKITVSKEELDAFVQGQRDSFIKMVDMGIESSLALKKSIEDAGMTIDEYYASKSIRNGYESLMLESKMLEEGIKGETDIAITAERRGSFIKELRDKADIVINQEVVKKYK